MSLKFRSKQKIKSPSIFESSDQRHEHVAAVSAKANRVLNLLRRHINFCTPEVKALAFTCLVRPYFLEYGLCLSFLDSITAIPIPNNQKECAPRRTDLSAYHLSFSATVRPQLVTLVISLQISRPVIFLSHIAGLSTSSNYTYHIRRQLDFTSTC